MVWSLDQQGQRAYGDTLLHAVRTGGGYREPFASVLLGENTELVRERLDAIMKSIPVSKIAGSGSYMLDMNPNGTVNIKISRGEDGVIQSVDYMTESEVEELFVDR